MYNRLINAPTSMVGHDDTEMYERAQQGLRAERNEWVNIQRLQLHDECPSRKKCIPVTVRFSSAISFMLGSNTWQQ